MTNVLIVDDIAPTAFSPDTNDFVQSVTFGTLENQPEILDGFEHVVVPLIGKNCDGLDVAAVLAAHRYQNLFTVVAPPIPRAHLVEREFVKYIKEMTFEFRIVA